MGADALAQVLRPLTPLFNATIPPDLLVGLGAADDAAVYRLRPDLAVIATVDLFPPIVDDPATFGAIAASNALGDIYAMGGQPLLALNVAVFPADLDPAILTEILRGGLTTVTRAGAFVAGGHTVTSPEPMYGLVALGTVHPDEILTKGGVQPGDALILTKPLGTGIITTALKNDAITAESAELAAAVASMSALHADALAVVRRRRAAGALHLHAGTDVTGFGLLGHAWEMLAASAGHVGLRFTAAATPSLPGARALAESGVAPGGTARNLRFVAPHTRWAPSVTPADRALLADPQTAGGLLLAVPATEAAALVAELEQAGVAAWLVAEATDSGAIEVM